MKNIFKKVFKVLAVWVAIATVVTIPTLTSLTYSYTYKWVEEWNIPYKEMSYAINNIHYATLDNYIDYANNLTDDQKAAIDESCYWGNTMDGDCFYEKWLHDYTGLMDNLVQQIIDKNNLTLSDPRIAFDAYQEYYLHTSFNPSFRYAYCVNADGEWMDGATTDPWFESDCGDDIMNAIIDVVGSYIENLDIPEFDSLGEYMEYWDNLEDKPDIRDSRFHRHDLLSMEVYGELVSQTSDCSNGGEVTYRCTLCGEEHTFPVENGGHVIEVIEVEPDCTNDGYRKEVCSVCGEEVSYDVIPATGHNAKLKVTTVTATCTEDGYERTECPDCGEIFNEKIFPATGHEGFLICAKCGQVNAGHVIPIAGGIVAVLVVLVVIAVRKKK